MRVLSLLLPAFIGLLAGGCDRDREQAAQPARRIKLGTVLQDSHPTAQALHFFAKRVEALSGGRLDAQVFPSSQLGSADELVDGMRTGDIEMAQVSVAIFAEYVPIANALSMPFIFRSPEHQVAVLDGEVGTEIAAKGDAVGLKLLGYLDSGTRNMTTKRGPIEKPEDLRGMKIRVMDVKLMVDAVNALGASAVAMNQGEVFTALQQGLLDGWENNPQTVVSFRMYETGCTYFAWTRHFSIPDLLVASEVFYQSLTPEERGWVDEAARETVAHHRESWKREEVKALEHMTAHGMKISDVDTAPFRARVGPIYEQYYARYGAEFRDVCERILNTP